MDFVRQRGTLIVQYQRRDYVSLNIQEVKKPELDAQLVADNLALARRLLAMPPDENPLVEAAPEENVEEASLAYPCPACGAGRLCTYG